MRIAGAGSAFPNNVYEQKAITSALKDAWKTHLDRSRYWIVCTITVVSSSVIWFCRSKPMVRLRPGAGE